MLQKSKILKQEWNWILVDCKWNFDENLDPDFIQLWSTCYIDSKWIQLNDQFIHSEQERTLVFYQLILQKLFLWRSLSHEFLEYSYDKENEFIWNKDLSKSQIEQSQWNMFALHWESPIRLSFLTNQTYDQKEIVLNSIFLKQIWNATRFCCQKGLLPMNMEYTMSQQPEDFEDFDLCIISKLNELYTEWEEIKNPE